MNNGNDKLELTLQSLETELEGYKKILSIAYMNTFGILLIPVQRK